MKRSRYIKQDGLELSIGNAKLPESTIILNMGPAHTCPSKQFGYCDLGSRCYAFKSEKRYPTVLNYRQRQAAYWKTTPTQIIYADFHAALHRIYKGKPLHQTIKHVRINESGDFSNQADVDKLSIIAQRLRYEFDVITYCYTSNPVLDFSNVHFVIRQSLNNFLRYKNPTINVCTRVIYKGEPVPGDHSLCPTTCDTCDICKQPTGNVAFRIH